MDGGYLTTCPGSIWSGACRVGYCLLLMVVVFVSFLPKEKGTYGKWEGGEAAD